MSRQTAITRLEKRLDQIQTAIAEVEVAGQSTSLGEGMSYTRGTLSRLYVQERKVIRALARAKGTVPMYQRVKMGGGSGNFNDYSGSASYNPVN